MAGNSSTPGDGLHRSIWIYVWVALGLALIVRTGVRDRGVITDSLEFGRRVLHGLDLYAPYLDPTHPDNPPQPLHPPYPPGFGLLTAPFSLLPLRLARFAWGFLQVCSLWAIAVCLRDMLRSASGRAAPVNVHWIYAVVALLAGRYILRDTHGGGGNLINLALVLFALDLARRDRAVPAGILLGFSLATKPVAVLVVPLLWFFGPRRAPGVAIAAAIGFTAVALLLLGQGMTPFLTWFDGSVQYAGMNDLFATPANGFPPFTWMNQCLRCCVTRYLGEVPPPFAGEGFAQGLGLSPAATSWIARGFSLALVGVTFLMIHGVARVRAARGWCIAAVLSLSLLLSPISWKAHHVALLPAFFMLGTVVLGSRSPRQRAWAWGFAGGYFTLCGVGEQFVGNFKDVQQSYYFTTIGTLAMLGFCLWQLRRLRRDLSSGRSLS